ncbi:hypothetical protein [Stenotrophomonas sepilia]|uniref:hypothetical protein n=2 Tax=Stenotrophomonas sepilia TaxID=2860290 RepID=UPI002E781A75|nr:hypothetical protein [Stenotrophomonas sepilia]
MSLFVASSHARLRFAGRQRASRARRAWLDATNIGITTPAMYLALSLMRSARRIAGADGPVSNSGRP